jgi:hypothetical protein
MQLPPCQGQGPAHLLTISLASAGPEAGTTPFRVRVRVRIGVRNNLLTISNNSLGLRSDSKMASDRTTGPKTIAARPGPVRWSDALGYCSEHHTSVARVRSSMYYVRTYVLTYIRMLCLVALVRVYVYVEQFGTWRYALTERGMRNAELITHSFYYLFLLITDTDRNLQQQQSHTFVILHSSNDSTAFLPA